MMDHQTILKEISEFVERQPLAASHSHRIPYSELKGQNDLFNAFTWHSGSTLISAGMPEEDYEQLKNLSLPEERKWALFRPYWEKIKYTAYGRSFLLATDRIFGIHEINDNTYQKLNTCIITAYTPESDQYFKTVLNDYAKIQLTIWDFGTLNAPEGYYPAYRFENRRVAVCDAFLTTRTREDLEAIEKEHHCTILTFDDYLATFERVFKEKTEQGMVAVKILLGYLRTLDFSPVTHDEAERVFNKIFSRILPNPGYLAHQFDGPDFSEGKLLQDYMVHKLFYLATQYKLPVQIHAGFQLGRRTVEEFGDPKLLNQVFIRYRDLKFVIMHTAVPYAYDLAVLAKNHSNVYVDFSWSNALSPSMAKRFFGDVIELVPIDRIIGFGDDSATVEGTLGEAIQARKMVSETLAEKVHAGYLSMQEAKEIASATLYKNTKNLFLGKNFPEQPKEE